MTKGLRNRARIPVYMDGARPGALFAAIAGLVLATPVDGQGHLPPAQDRLPAPAAAERPSERERLHFPAPVDIPLATPQRLEAIRDGTSKTLMLGEKRTEGELEGCSAPARASLSALGIDTRSPVRVTRLGEDQIEVRIISRLNSRCMLIGTFMGWPSKVEAPYLDDAARKTVHPGVYILEVGDATRGRTSGRVRILGPADMEERARRGTLRWLRVEVLPGPLADMLARVDREAANPAGRLSFAAADGRQLAIEVPNLKITFPAADDTDPAVRVELRFPRAVMREQ